MLDTWNVKGQNGTSTRDDGDDAEIIGANPMFISMYRNDTRGGGEGSGMGRHRIGQHQIQIVRMYPVS